MVGRLVSWMTWARHYKATRIQSTLPQGFFTRMAKRGCRLQRSDIMGRHNHQINVLFNRLPAVHTSA